MDPFTLTGLTATAIVSSLAAWKSWQADRQTRHTGNGFAGEVLGKLASIEGKIDRHIESHAEADVSRRRR